MNQEQQNKQFELNEKLVAQEVFCCVTPMVDYILRISSHFAGEHNAPFNWDDVENLYFNADCAECREGHTCEEPEPQEIFEWWAVSPWLFEKLREEGEPVIDTFPHLWGRTTSGQAIALDGVITRIQKKTEYGGKV